MFASLTFVLAGVADFVLVQRVFLPKGLITKVALKTISSNFGITQEISFLIPSLRASRTALALSAGPVLYFRLQSFQFG